MCLWIKVDASWASAGGDPIALHYVSANTQIMSLLWVEQGEIVFVFQVSPDTQHADGLKIQRLASYEPPSVKGF